MKSISSVKAITALLALSAASSQAAIVFSEVNLSDDSIVLLNIGETAVALDGWRFCSHDTDSVRVYSSTSEFNGLSIAAGATLTIDTSEINFAGPLGGNVMSIGLYENSSFGSPDALQSFIQFRPEDSTDLGSSEFRTSTAVAAGLWDAEGSFVEIAAGQNRIVINDPNTATGAASYAAIPEPSSFLLSGLGVLLACVRRKR